MMRISITAEAARAYNSLKRLRKKTSDDEKSFQHFRCRCHHLLATLPSNGMATSIFSALFNKRLTWFSPRYVSDVTNDTEDTIWNRYRQPITKELWNEFSNDVAETRKWATASPIYQQMYQEIQENIRKAWEDPEPVPEYGPTGKWMYQFVFRRDDNNVRIYQRCSARKEDGKNNPQSVAIFDPDEELLSMSLSPDETCVASLVQKSTTQGPQTELRIRHIDLGIENNLAGPLKQQYAADSSTFGDLASVDDIVSVEWGPPIFNDDDTWNQPLYAVLTDKEGRPYRVDCWRIDPISMTLMEPLQCIYESNDPSVFVDVQRTKGCQYVAIQGSTKTSNEIHLCRNPMMPLIPVKPQEPGVRYHIDVGQHEDVVLLISSEKHNDGNYSLMETSVDSLPLEKYNEMSSLEHANDDVEFFIEDMDLFQNHLVLYERSKHNSMQRIRLRHRHPNTNDFGGVQDETIIDISSLENGRINGKLSPSGNIHFNATSLQFHVESPTILGSIYQYAFKERRLSKVTTEAHSNLDQFNSCKRDIVFVKSQDGTNVPMSIYRSPKKEDEVPDAGPVVLTGYGAYGEPANLGYDPSLAALLHRGAVLAFAMTRGGGDLGKSWYHAGRRENKLQGIEDFEASALHLKSLFPDRKLTCKGFSAGGVLVGAVVNRQPELFDRVVLTNAFLDVHATMRTPSLFLTEHEYDEFGDPNTDKAINDIIFSYCPVSNLDTKSRKYAHTKLLIIGALDDPNVPYWNATVYFKKLTSAQNTSQNRNAFLELQTEGGHNISGPNRLHVWSLENAFLLTDTM
jgi:protease II